MPVRDPGDGTPTHDASGALDSWVPPLAIHAQRGSPPQRQIPNLRAALCYDSEVQSSSTELSFPCAEVDPDLREHSFLHWVDGPYCSCSSSSGAQGTTCPGWTSDATHWTRRMASYRRAWLLQPGPDLGSWPRGQPSCATCHPMQCPPTALLSSCPASWVLTESLVLEWCAE